MVLTSYFHPKIICFAIAKLLVWGLLGLQIRHREHLPTQGPAILIANHNSHLDTIVLMSLFSFPLLPQIRPVANATYFLGQNRYLAWLARSVFNIIPIAPSQPLPGSTCLDHRQFLTACGEALAQNQILILYPEGSRGQPETMGALQSGIAHLAKRHPNVPIVPIFLQGLGKALPKGERLLVPFICSIAIGLPLYWHGPKQTFLQALTQRLQSLAQ
jgi:1-acyl-sn-glycerol-3-phosphate acyltransferase